MYSDHRPALVLAIEAASYAPPVHFLGSLKLLIGQLRIPMADLD